MRQRHQKQQRQRLLSSLPAAPARLSIVHLHLLPPLALKDDEEGGGGGEVEGGGIDPAACTLLLGSRHVEKVRCLGMVVKYEAGAGFWLDDGTGVVFVEAKRKSSPPGQDLLPPVGRLCEVVGPLKLRRIPVKQSREQLGQEQEQRGEEMQVDGMQQHQEDPQQHTTEVRRTITAQHIFMPQDPNVETAFTLSTLELFRNSYTLQHNPSPSDHTYNYISVNGPSPPPLPPPPPPPPHAPSAPPSPSSSSSSSSSASIDGLVLNHILRLQVNGQPSVGVDLQALQGIVPSKALFELEASLSRLQMDGLVYNARGFPPYLNMQREESKQWG